MEELFESLGVQELAELEAIEEFEAEKSEG